MTIPGDGNGLGACLARLAADLALNAGQQHRVALIAERLGDLAEEAAERDAAVVPAHLRVAISGLPDNVARLCDRRRA